MIKFLILLFFIPVLTAVQSSDLGVRFSKFNFILTCDEICTDTFKQIKPILIQSIQCNCETWKARKDRIPIDDENYPIFDSENDYSEGHLSASGDGLNYDEELAHLAKIFSKQQLNKCVLGYFLRYPFICHYIFVVHDISYLPKSFFALESRSKINYMPK